MIIKPAFKGKSGYSRISVKDLPQDHVNNPRQIKMLEFYITPVPGISASDEGRRLMSDIVKPAIFEAFGGKTENMTVDSTSIHGEIEKVQKRLKEADEEYERNTTDLWKYQNYIKQAKKDIQKSFDQLCELRSQLSRLQAMDLSSRLQDED